MIWENTLKIFDTVNQEVSVKKIVSRLVRFWREKLLFIIFITDDALNYPIHLTQKVKCGQTDELL